MDPLVLARWQFGITTIYHFLFVPLTIGLALLVAVMQTAWYRTRKPEWLRMTRFWGKLFLVNFAMGVVTGIVQEFQFGMNWSSYSRYVGDIFGAPLAIEGLLAFFLESTFLGLWIFGWDKLSPKLHLATIWLAAIGTCLSAYFILAANSWMQHPVGYAVNEATGRAELRDFFALLTNSTVLIAFPHTVFAALLTAALFMLGISAWHLLRENEVEVFRRSATMALVVGFTTSMLVALTGHTQAQVMTDQQPMKMAAAEALWETESPAGFSLFAVGDRENGRNRVNIVVPHGLSILATNTFDGEVRGINDLQAEYERTYGPGDYRPNVGLAYWTFRAMVGLGFAMIALTAAGLVLLRRKRLVGARWFHKAALVAIAFPFLANAVGWVFTEMGRQPWAVFGLLRTAQSVSPKVSATSVAITMAGFTIVYGMLAVADLWLMARFARRGPVEPVPADSGERIPAMSY